MTDADTIASTTKLTTQQLRWMCDDSQLSFANTTEVTPVAGVVGQDDAVDALRFGLEFNGPGQNIYVRGLTGTGRATLVEHMLHDIQPPCALAEDRCYAHNFEHPDTPKLLTLSRGQGPALQHAIERLIEFIKQDLGPALNSDAIRARRADLDDTVQKTIREQGKPFEEELRANGLALVPVQMGQSIQPTILPLVKDQPVSMEEYEAYAQQAGATPQDIENLHSKILQFARKFEDVSIGIHELQSNYRKSLRDLFQSEARRILGFQTAPIEQQFPAPAVSEFLAQLTDDLVEHRLESLGQQQDFTRLYRINTVLTHSQDETCPVIKETSPSLQNLLGNIDREFSATGSFRSDHLMIHAGSLLRADGGFLVIEARDVLSEPGAWRILLRTLKTGQLEIVPAEFGTFWSGPMLKPEPIPLNVKVILIGDAGLYQLLDMGDPDFSHMFKVLADFDSTIDRNKEGVEFYAGILARFTQDENMLPFHRSGVTAMVEHGARIAGHQKRLTTRFGRLTDVAREAVYLAQRDNAAEVTREHVYEAIRRGRHRSDLPARRYRDLMTDGTIRIDTEGQVVGQINGLAVIQSGPLTYGFPSRITASIGVGTSGTVNIEREAELSGAIHTKGFYILSGLLRNLLRTQHPLAFSASVAFEQSYGGIDGDSASGAEMVCLLSSLTDVPLRQDLAMTGAIDQHGHILAIGAATEKIEGFYSLCEARGLTGSQGVVIPKSNAGDLMLKPEIVEACAAGKFSVYAVDTIFEALSLFTGKDAGTTDGSGEYADGTLLHLAQARAQEFWRMASDHKKS
jgi:lon-related putative ATP-dependent protease